MAAQLFDDYLVLDWSAAARPRLGRDSIWLYSLSRSSSSCENLRTRKDAVGRLQELLAVRLQRNRRVLVGCDFAFGYPVGFAERLRLHGVPWRATWKMFRDAIEDAPNNGNNRFSVAAALNRRISGGRGPFWGCPARVESPALGPRRLDAADAGLESLRLCDKRAHGAQSPFKLYTAGSVGSQSLLGIARLAALRFNSPLGEHCRIWPFETGWNRPPDIPVVFAEVFPSLTPFRRQSGEVRDAAQVRTTAHWLLRQDHGGSFGDLLRGPGNDVSAAKRRAALREEGWILGVS